MNKFESICEPNDEFTKSDPEIIQPQEQSEKIITPAEGLENYNSGRGEKIVLGIVDYLEKNVTPEAMNGVSSFLTSLAYFSEAINKRNIDSIYPLIAGADFAAAGAGIFAKGIINKVDVKFRPGRRAANTNPLT